MPDSIEKRFPVAEPTNRYPGRRIAVPVDPDDRTSDDVGGSVTLTSGTRQRWLVQGSPEELGAWLANHLQGNSWGAITPIEVPTAKPLRRLAEDPNLPDPQMIAFDYWGEPRTVPWPTHKSDDDLRTLQTVAMWKPAKPTGPELKPDKDFGERLKEAAEAVEKQTGTVKFIVGAAAVIAVAGAAMYLLPGRK